MKQRKKVGGEYVEVMFRAEGNVCVDPMVAARILRRICEESALDADVIEVTFRRTEVVGRAHVPIDVEDVDAYREELNRRVKTIVDVANFIAEEERELRSGA